MLKIAWDRRPMKAALSSILLAVAFLVGTPAANGEDRRPVRDVYEAIRIAEAMLAEEEEYYVTGYANGEIRLRDVRKYHDALNYLTVNDASNYDRALRDKLEGRRYWYVVFSNADLLRTKGGGISFFIDADTSELIHTYKSI